MVHEQKNAAATKQFAAMKIASVRRLNRRIRVQSAVISLAVFSLYKD